MEKKIKKRKSRLEGVLNNYDKKTSKERLKRLKYISKIMPKGYMMCGSPESAYIFDEVKMTFINGESIATVILAQAFIERRLQEILDFRGFKKESKNGLSEISKFLRKNKIINDFILGKIDNLRKKRNLLEDILSQIRNELDSDTIVKHLLVKEYVEFKEYAKSVEKGVSVKDKDDVLDDEIEGNIIGGYKKTIFPENSFDTKQEKCFADILHKDKEVESWLRNPKGQFTIRVKIGGYSPDFIVRTKNTMYLIEIKERKAIDNKDPDVFEKPKEAKRWCGVVSKTSKTKWEYKLIPHDSVIKKDSFMANLSRAVSI